MEAEHNLYIALALNLFDIVVILWETYLAWKSQVN